MASGNNRLTQAMRIKSSQEFSATFRKGLVVADKTLVAHLVLAAGSRGRLGISIPKKTGNAPCRNRWKRLIREAYRLEVERIPAGLQLVLRPRKGAVAEYQAVRKSLLSIVRRAQKKLDRLQSE